MKTYAPRLLAVAVLAVLAWITLSAASGKGPNLQPDKLVVISTTDVRGKSSPCG